VTWDVPSNVRTNTANTAGMLKSSYALRMITAFSSPMFHHPLSLEIWSYAHKVRTSTIPRGGGIVANVAKLAELLKKHDIRSLRGDCR
jgi:hypothetical protein